MPYCGSHARVLDELVAGPSRVEARPEAEREREREHARREARALPELRRDGAAEGAGETVQREERERDRERREGDPGEQLGERASSGHQVACDERCVPISIITR